MRFIFRSGLVCALGVSIVFAPVRASAQTVTEAVPASLPDLPKLAQLPQEGRTAIEAAHRAAQANPRDSEANGKLGMALHAAGLYAEAEACYRRARAFDSASFRWAYYLALDEAVRGDFERGAATLEQALRLDPEYLPARLNLGECRLATAEWPEAARAYEAVLKAHPESAQAWYGLARAQAARNDLAGAERSFQKALELFASYGAAHFGLAHVYDRLGKTDQAAAELAAFEKDRNAAPDPADRLLEQLWAANASPAEWMSRGTELARQARYADAEGAFRNALAADPSSAEARTRLGEMLEAQGKPAEAAAEYQKALDANPNDPQAHFALGRMAVNAENCPEAIRHLSASAAGGSGADLPTYVYALGAAYARCGNAERALKFLRDAKEKATALGQTRLVESIDEDLKTLQGGATSR